MAVDLKQFTLGTVSGKGYGLGHTGIIDTGGCNVGASRCLHLFEVNHRTVGSHCVLDNMGVVNSKGYVRNADKTGKSDGGINCRPLAFRTARFTKRRQREIHIGKAEANITAGCRTFVTGKSIDAGHAEHKYRG